MVLIWWLGLSNDRMKHRGQNGNQKYFNNVTLCNTKCYISSFIYCKTNFRCCVTTVTLPLLFHFGPSSSEREVLLTTLGSEPKCIFSHHKNPRQKRNYF